MLEKGKLVGIITSDDIMREPIHMLPKRKVKDAMSKSYIYVYSDDSIKKAIEILYSKGIGKLLVVSRKDSRKLEGVLTKTDIIKAYIYITSL